jgi:hypothetical protein
MTGTNDLQGSLDDAAIKREMQALPEFSGPADAADDEPGNGETITYRLIQALESDPDLEFFESMYEDRILYMTFRNRYGFLENHRVVIDHEAPSYEWIMQKLYVQSNTSVSTRLVQTAVNQIASNARYGASAPLRQYPIRVRCATADGVIYIDMCNSQSQVIEIDPAKDGPAIVTYADIPKIKFLRYPEMLPLPKPDFDGDIEGLREFVNAPDDKIFSAIKASMVDVVKGEGMNLLTHYQGEYRSQKTTTAEKSMGVS